MPTSLFLTNICWNKRTRLSLEEVQTRCRLFEELDCKTTKFRLVFLSYVNIIIYYLCIFICLAPLIIIRMPFSCPEYNSPCPVLFSFLSVRMWKVICVGQNSMLFTNFQFIQRLKFIISEIIQWKWKFFWLICLAMGLRLGCVLLNAVLLYIGNDAADIELWPDPSVLAELDVWNN